MVLIGECAACRIRYDWSLCEVDVPLEHTSCAMCTGQLIEPRAFDNEPPVRPYMCFDWFIDARKRVPAPESKPRTILSEIARGAKSTFPYVAGTGAVVLLALAVGYQQETLLEVRAIHREIAVMPTPPDQLKLYQVLNALPIADPSTTTAEEQR